MVETRDHFAQRLNHIGSKHQKLKRGYTTKVTNNGIIVAQPVKKSRRYIPFKGMLLTVLCFFAFKAFILAANGPDAYADRLASLENGTVFEQAGAMIMTVDPATAALANIMGPVLR